MKDFKDWGIRFRKLKEYDYLAIWHNLKTIRFGEDKVLELPPNEAEFYDVSLNSKCNALCPFCYVSATKNGENYTNICETWVRWMNSREDKKIKGGTLTTKPFQIAIGE